MRPLTRRVWLLFAMVGFVCVACIYQISHIIVHITPAQHINSAWDAVKLSGSYTFRSEIDQYRDYAPSLNNFGAKSIHNQFLVEGHVNESTQESHIVVTNRDDEHVILEVRRAQSRTYTRVDGGAWQEGTVALSSYHLDAIALLDGVSTIDRVDTTTQLYTFTFNGAQFMERMQERMHMARTQGGASSASFADLTNNSRLWDAHGRGEIDVYADGLPQRISMTIEFPRSTNTGAVSTHIETTFANYARSGLMLKRLLNDPLSLIARWWQIDMSVMRNVLVGSIMLVVLAIGLVMVRHRRQQLYLPVSVLVAAMCIYQPYSTIPRTQASTRPDPTIDGTTTTPADIPAASPTPAPLPVEFNPRISPLQQQAQVSYTESTTPATRTRSAQQGVRTPSGTSVTDPNLDSDSDGLTDQQEELLQTSLTLRDSDNDGLSDFAETQIGTNPLATDSDLDGIDDGVEASFATGTLALYSNPLVADTNGDGLSDGLECDIRISALYSDGSATDCGDTDTDGVPDFLDDDNDGDLVPDMIDVSPSARSGSMNTPYTATRAFGLRLSDVYASRSTPRGTLVEVQFRPKSANLLYANQAVYDWPSNDKKGQIQRTKQSTFAQNSQTGTDTSSAKLATGDLRVSAALEMRIPISANNYANLPVLACAASNSCLPQKDEKQNLLDIPNWLDSARLREYGINAAYSYDANGVRNSNELTLVAPVSPVFDSNNSVVAYSSMFYYEPQTSTWTDAHTIRMQWMVSQIQDWCPPDRNTCTDGERVESISTVQTYYSDWFVTGIRATEFGSYQAAVIYEDAAQPVNTASESRRLNIIKAHHFIENQYIDKPLLSVRADATPQSSLYSMFDNRRNNTLAVQRFGIAPEALRSTHVSYTSPTDTGGVIAYTVDTVLDSVACRINPTVDGCTGKNESAIQAIRNACINNTSPRCQPAVIIVSEGNERTAVLDTNQVVSFSGVEAIETRSVQGMWYKATSSGWEAFDEFDMNGEISMLTPQAVLTNTQLDPIMPGGANPSDWQSLNQSALIHFVMNFAALAQRNTPVTWLPSTRTVSDTDALDTSWRGYFVRFMGTYADFFARIIATAPRNFIAADGTMSQTFDSQMMGVFTTLSESAPPPSGRTFTSVALSLAPSTVATFYLAQRDAITRVTPVQNATPTQPAAWYIRHMSKFIAFGKLAKQGYADYTYWSTNKKPANPISSTPPTPAKPGWFANTLKSVKTKFQAGISKLVSKFSSARPAGPPGFFSRLGTRIKDFGGKMKNVLSKGWAKYGKFIGIAIAAAMFIVNMLNARPFAWEYGNVTAQFVGQVLKEVLFLVIATIPGGQLLILIIQTIDIIAEVACSFLTPKQRRSSAAQWLCGGISGLIVNYFTFYKSSLVIDNDDIYSHFHARMPVTPTLTLPSNGFVIGNAWKTEFAITDFIEKMPFPATWMALPYFWQWNGFDERNTSFGYVLAPQKTDNRGAIAVGSQRGNYQRTQSTDQDLLAGVSEVSWNDFTWRQTQNIAYRSALTTSGINQPLPKLYLSKAFITQRQECFVIPIFILFFPIPIPICLEKSHSSIDYEDITGNDTTTFDIFPTTIEGFLSMRTGDGGYTFDWNPDTSSLKFPVFVDADNDGLTNAQEGRAGSADNDWDSDDDTIDDQTEVINGTSPLFADSDNDGLSDSREVRYNTNPLLMDTDGDGLSDGEEIVRVENGQRKGGWEVVYEITTDALGNEVVSRTWMGSDPRKADGDGDGVIDLRERLLGWSAYAKNSSDIVRITGRIREARAATLTLDFANSSSSGYTSTGILATTARCINGCRTDTSAFNNPSVALRDNQQLTLPANPDYFAPQQFTAAARVIATRTKVEYCYYSYFWMRTCNEYDLFDAILSQAGLFTLERRSTNGQLYVTLSTQYGIGQYATGLVLPPNRSTHISVSYDGVVLVVYIDGIERYREAVSGRLTDVDASNNDLRIGGWQRSRGQQTIRTCVYIVNSCLQTYETGTTWQGYIDDVALYGMALSANDMALLAQNALSNDNDLIVRPGESVIADTTFKNMLLGRVMQGDATFQPTSTNYTFPADDSLTYVLARNATLRTSNVVTVPGSIDVNQTISAYRAGCAYTSAVWCLALDEGDSSIRAQTLRFADLSGNSYHLSCTAPNQCPTSVNEARMFTKELNQSHYQLQSAPAVGNSISKRDFTISLWYKPVGQPVVKRTLLSNGSTFELYLANQSPSARVVPVLKTGDAVLTATSSLPYADNDTNSWNHVVVRMRERLRQIFVNGVLVAQDTQVVPYPASAYGSLILGNDTSNNYALGGIRDLQIYQTALSDAHISALATTCDDMQLLLCMAPARYIPATSTIPDSALAGDAQALTLQCISCSGATTNSIQITNGILSPGSATLLHQRSFTLQLKYKMSTVGGTQTLLASGDGTQLALRLVGGKAQLTLGGATTTLTDSVSSGTWYLLSVTYDRGQAQLSQQRVVGGVIDTQTIRMASTGITNAQDALAMGNSAFTLGLLRISAGDMPHVTRTALAQLLLRDTATAAQRTVPQSDRIDVGMRSITKVIDPDANGELLPTQDTCTLSSMRLCLRLGRLDDFAFQVTGTQPIGVISCVARNNCPTLTGGGASVSTGQYVALNESAKTVFMATATSRSYTVMAWIRPHVLLTSADQGILTDSSTTAGRIQMVLRNGKLAFRSSGRTLDANAMTSLDVNRWYHVAFVKQYQSRIIYVDGIEVARDSTTSTTLGDTDVTTLGELRIGDNFIGALNNIQIHAAPLDVHAVRLAAQAQLHELAFTFDQPSGATLFTDPRNNGYSLVCGARCPQSGVAGRDTNAVRLRSGQSLQLNPSSSELLNTILRFGRASIALWVRPTRYNQWIIGADDGQQPLQIRITESGAVSVRRTSTCSGNACRPALVSPTAIPLNQWTHLIVSTDAVTEMLYINGVLARQQNNPLATTGTGVMRIGGEFNGDIDGLTIRAEPSNAQTAIRLYNGAPSWQLRFEETLTSTPYLPNSAGVSQSTTVAHTLLPDGTTRYGFARVAVAASCVSDMSTCPVVDDVGYRGMAATFNGTTSMLTVNGAQSLLDELKFGGTIQFMVRPEPNTPRAQTILRYGSPNSADAPVHIQLTPLGLLDVSVGPYRYTTSQALPPAWNQISINFGADGFSYFQNGISNTSQSITRTTLLSPIFTTDSSYVLTLGGYRSASTLTAPFAGGVDELSFTPVRTDSPKIYRIARALMAHATTAQQIGTFTVDSDVPSIQIEAPIYASATAVQFALRTSDATSYVTKANTTITAYNGVSALVATPECEDAKPGTAYCPTFQSPLTSNKEGRYTITADAVDVVNNRNTTSTPVLIDTTPPNATLLPPNNGLGVYTVTPALRGIFPMLQLEITASDPVLLNAPANTPGSGVATVEVNLRDMAGRTLIPAFQPATLRNGRWYVSLPLPFVNPSGFYQVVAFTSDTMGNRNPQALVLAGTSNPIEIDAHAPQDAASEPSPLQSSDYLVSNAYPPTGRISDIGDGRAPLQRDLRIRYDFETEPSETTLFDNRITTQYLGSCQQCPLIITDAQRNSRVALFNIGGTRQTVRINDGAPLLNNIYSMALMFKASDSGTLIGAGAANNPRLRVALERDTSAPAGQRRFLLRVNRGTGVIRSPLRIDADVWYYLVVNESATDIRLAVGQNLTSMTSSTLTFNAPLNHNENVLWLGSMPSATQSLQTEDFFRGAIDDFLVSTAYIEPLDLLGPSVAVGSGVHTHATRLDIQDDGYAMRDTVGPKTQFYAPIAVRQLPIVDVMTGSHSDTCNGGLTRDTYTCPEISQGLTSNALLINHTSDGLVVAPRFSNGITSTLSASWRIGISDQSQSGRLVTLTSQSPITPALQFTSDYDAEHHLLQLGITDGASNLLYALHVPLDVYASLQWHHVALVSSAQGDNTSIRMYINGRFISEFNDTTLHWNRPTIVVGAYQSPAATATRIDDIAYFHTAITDGEVRFLSHGMTPFIHADFDDSATNSDASPYQHALTFSQPIPVTGIIGAGALRFNGTTTVSLRDRMAHSIADLSEPWSASVWVEPSGSANGEIVRGTLADYTYTLALIANKYVFALGGLTLTATNTYSGRRLVTVVNDGSTWTMYVDGTRIDTVLDDTITMDAPNANLALNRPATQTSVDGDNDAQFAVDGNANQTLAAGSVAMTTEESAPTWQVDLGRVTLIDRIDVYLRTDCCLDAMQNLVVRVKDTTNTVWTYVNPETRVVAGFMQFVLPDGIRGRYVEVALSNSAVLAIAEVVVHQDTRIVIGNGFNGVIDDLYIYPRALTVTEITQQYARKWQSSTLTASRAGAQWQNAFPVDVEATGTLYSISSDLAGNARTQREEQRVWQGRVDTRKPRVTATETLDPSTNLYQYTMSADDRNLTLNSLQTPCGRRFSLTAQYHDGLAYLANTGYIDGSLREISSLTGGCTYGAVPDFVRGSSVVVSATTTLAAGPRFHYLGGVNHLSVVDTHADMQLVQHRIAITGTVSTLTMSSDATTLYVVSQNTRPATQLIVSVFALNDTPDKPQRIATLTIPVTSLNVVDATVVADNRYLVLLSDESPSRLLPIDMRDRTQPTQQLAQPLLEDYRGYALSSSYAFVAVAQGSAGVALYSIDGDGTLALRQSIATSGYVHRVVAVTDMLYVVVDDDSMVDGRVPNDPNTLESYQFISTVAGQTELVANMQPRASYIHTALSDDAASITAFHINDVIPYLNNEILLLSTQASNTASCLGCQRISIIESTTPTTTLRSEAVTVSAGTQIARAGNDIVVLAPTRTGTSSSIDTYQISDRRIATTLCDRVGNCTVQPSTRAFRPVVLDRNAPAQNSAILLNSADIYTQTTNLNLRFRVDALEPIERVTLLVDGMQSSSVYTPTTSVQSLEQFFVLSSVTHGLHNVQLRVETPTTTFVSPSYSFVADTQAPVITVANPVVGINNLIDGFIKLNVRISDDGAFTGYRISNKATGQIYPLTNLVNTEVITTGTQQVISADVFVPYASLTQPFVILQVDATDVARRTTSRTLRFDIDAVAPQLVNPQLNAMQAGKLLPVTSMPLTRTTNLDLHLGWSAISDMSAITLRQLEYHIQSVTETTRLTSLLMPTSLRTPALVTREGSRIDVAIRTRDTYDNEQLHEFPSVYVDSATTPDYTLFDATQPVYRGWMNRGCAVLDSDTREQGRYGTQQLAVTWDSAALRLMWAGADWDVDGDLAIYLDSQPGGTVRAFRPAKYTQSLAEQQLNGESFITLPTNFAARATGTGSMAQMLTQWRQRLFAAQHGRSTGSVEGADYVIYVSDQHTLSLWQWDAPSGSWLLLGEQPQYRYSSDGFIEYTDIRLPFSTVNYDPSTPLGVVAMALKEDAYLPWASFPTSNPIRTSMNGDMIVALPFINGFAWPALRDGVCPRTATQLPSTTQIQATLASDPIGASQRSVSDIFANTEPDALAQIINDTAVLCGYIPDNEWCASIARLVDSASAGSAILAGLRNENILAQNPVLGRNSVITYTLSIANSSAQTSQVMYGVVHTYGGVWLTTPVDNVTVVGAGNYTYHTVSDSSLQDYLFVKIDPILAGKTRTITLRGVVDPDKAQASASDRISTGDVAKLEVRLTDQDPRVVGTPSRTIEWLNAAVRIDTQAPSQVLPSNGRVVKTGNSIITGTISDESSIQRVELLYTSNVNASAQFAACQVVLATWQCVVNVPTNASSVQYRLRASDRYGAMNGWSSWYTATVDNDKPTFSFDATTTDLLARQLANGSGLQISGTITDSTTTTDLVICDESQADCNVASIAGALSQTTPYTGTVTSPQAISAGPCGATLPSDYTAYAITLAAPASARVDNLQLAVRVAHDESHDVNLWLRSPSGTRVALVTSTRATGSNVVAQFADNATRASTAISGTTAIDATYLSIQPDMPLATFHNESLAGIWHVLACDRDGADPSGTLTSATLTIQSQSPARHQNAVWQHTISSTESLDGSVRHFSAWARDSVGNVSRQRAFKLRIDSVAPIIEAFLSYPVISNTLSIDLFTGRISDGSGVDSLQANLYRDGHLIQVFDIPLTASGSGTTAQPSVSPRVASYTWTLPFDPKVYDIGTYTMQFHAVDVVGNQSTSTVYAFAISEPQAPFIGGIHAVAPNTADALTLNIPVNSQFAETNVVITMELDTTSSVITTTSLAAWSYNNPSVIEQDETFAQLQMQRITQLGVNQTYGAALLDNGTVRTWDIDADNPISVTSVISTVSEIALPVDSLGDTPRLLLRFADGHVGDVVTSTVRMVMPDVVASQIAAGRDHVAVLLPTGQVQIWNYDDVGNIIPSDTTLQDIVYVTAGEGFSLALTGSGTITSWGDNSRGQRDVPVHASANVRAIASGRSHSLALVETPSGGVVVAWGDNAFGQSSVPADIGDVVSIFAGEQSSAALSTDGRIHVWGQNSAPPQCCANHVALGNQLTIIEYKPQTYSGYTAIPIGGALQYKSVSFMGLMPGRRYRYSVIARNRLGSTRSSGVVYSGRTYAKIYVPMASTDNSDDLLWPESRGVGGRP